MQKFEIQNEDSPLSTDTLQNTVTVLTGLGPPIFQKLRRRTTKRQSCDSRLCLGPEFYRPLGLFSHLSLKRGIES